ncbi:response regulator [Acinetobacter schindleri]|uniref:response regulator n=1 Tax=Acinetobacter TaxID=469 RepID=UPI0008F55679|nr:MULTISPECIES: response regulator [Acinetobacter]MCU4323027.1 response regulator [Acinetobacter schindleri]OIJ38735.1 DNA-binding response regulator [Acinetobacter sp. LCT-H3]
MLESILIVDDIPENLSLLHESLDQAGYQVLVATNGFDAIEIAHRIQPDMILLDGSMPEMDGFETCTQLKASPVTEHIPVIFMTGLTETEHILKGFQVGGVDYVTKPLNIDEVRARVKTHLLQARLMHQQRQMLDATGSAILSLNLEGEIIWQTPIVSELLKNHQVDVQHFQSSLNQWLQDLLKQPDQAHLLHGQYGYGHQQLQLNLLTKLYAGHISKHVLVQLKEQTQMPSAEEIAQACPNLTPREAEVMHWVTMGKTNRDIAEILQLSPRTVNKHLEHVFEKLYVETRTAAVLHVMSACQNQAVA